jgi:hypothetical protein
LDVNGKLDIKLPNLHELQKTAQSPLRCGVRPVSGKHVDRSNIALWLGYERLGTTQIYLEAMLAMKEKALAGASPPQVTPGATNRVADSSPS